MNKYIYQIYTVSSEMYADSLKQAREKLKILKEFISQHYNSFKILIIKIDVNTGDEKIIYRKEVLE